MSSYRVPLFNFHVWTCLVDVFVHSLMAPYAFLPTLSIFTVGLLNFLGVPTKIQVWLAFQNIHWMLTSTTILVESRNNAIPFNKFKISRKSTKTLYYLTKLLMGTFYAASTIFFIPANQEEARFEVLKQLPCPAQEFFTVSNILVLSIDKDYSRLIIALTTMGVLSEAIQIAFYFICCVYYLFFSVRSFTSFTSKTTKKFHIKLLTSILLQIFVPMLFLFPTAFYIWFSVYFNYHNQALTNLSFVYSSIHGLISTFTILIIHSPYRQFILSCFRKPEPKQFVRNIEM
ncbi:Serpentine Receptor, class H [Caenorhabditis elegans]|uniref:Serpentine Receptor, class H n=1 Tax=Caenorhabditis elegans TaxID=6239 RepID=A0A0M6VDE6_CAEEL|nr:Serpentine Receptor, class H [Caenorhabditis elegans]CEO42550.2 Serpentine Receptor, class H [Caenorhabditis elegans]|eukprot:NP_001303776.1 Serpentine Receptor, class H [Caenorhabditis elegans]